MKTSNKVICLALTLIFVLMSCPVSVSAAQTGSNYSIIFNSSSSTVGITSSQNSQYSYNASEGALLLRATASGTPGISIDYSLLGSLSANEYKYFVITCKAPTFNSIMAVSSKAYFSVGSSQDVCTAAVSLQRGHKYYSQIVDFSQNVKWSGSVGTLNFNFFSNAKKDDVMFLDSLIFCRTAEDAEAAASARMNAKNALVADYTEADLDSGSYKRNQYIVPYWDSDIVYNESVFVIGNQDGTVSPFPLMYDASQIISVRDWSLNKEYTYGVDYVLQNGKLVILTSGAISVTPYSEIFNPQYGGYNMTGGGTVYWTEGSYFHKHQIAVTYVHTSEWSDSVKPTVQGNYLPKTIQKLENKEDLHVVYFGDSLIWGVCSSAGPNNGEGGADRHFDPYAEIFTTMTTNALRDIYGYSGVTNYDISYGGYTADGMVNQTSLATDQNPDLVVIAYGMNDGMTRVSKSTYKSGIQGMINNIQSARPNCEIIVIASCVANDLCHPTSYFSDYRDAIFEIQQSEGVGVAVADMTTINLKMLERKDYLSTSGNNMCHPNDFIARLYAQVLINSMSSASMTNYASYACSIIENYASASNYDTAGQAALTAAKNAGKAVVNASATPSQAYRAVLDAKEAIDEIKTAADSAVASYDYSKLVFDSAAKLGVVSSANNVSVTYNSADNAALARVTAASSPSFTIDYSKANERLSADDNKYIVLTYKAPSTVSSAATIVSLCSGAIENATSGFSAQFTPVKGNQYQSYIFDLNANIAWTGNINKLVFNIFSGGQAGDSMYIKSVYICSSASEAASAAGGNADMANGISAEAPDVVSFEDDASLSQLSVIEGVIVFGDVDGNGTVTLGDMLNLRYYLCGLAPEGFSAAAADVNLDGRINMLDALRVRKCLAGLIELGTLQGSNVSNSFDASEKSAKFTVGAIGAAAPRITIDYSAKGLLVADYDKILITYKTSSENSATASTMTVFPCGGATTFPDELQSVDVSVSSDDEFTTAIVDLSDKTYWTDGTINSIAIDVLSDGVENDVIYISSVILYSSTGASALAESVDTLKNMTYTLGYKTLSFNTAQAAQRVSGTNNVTASYDAINSALKLTAKDSGTDPFAFLDFTSDNISADTYKYVIITYKATLTKANAATTELFLCTTGGVSGPAAGYSVNYTPSLTSAFVTQYLDFSALSYWNGNLTGIRLDCFSNANAGDCFYLESITFCKTTADASFVLTTA